VLVREGLERLLVWAALFRNWPFRDWISLAEVGWKPYRIALYPQGTNQTEIDKLQTLLERLGEMGLGVAPVGTDIRVEWPKTATAGKTSMHRELCEYVGREMSKAILGQTTSIESGEHGTQSDTKTRDQIRFDIRESDARATAAALRECLFKHVVAFNIGPKARCPVPWFLTEEDNDQLTFSEALKNLHDMGVRIPAKWAREEFGMPEPIEGEEVIEPAVQVQNPKQLGKGDNPDDELDIPVEVEDEEDDTPPAKRAKNAGEDPTNAGARSGLEYSDGLTASGTVAGAKAIAPTVAALLVEIEKAESYEEALRSVEQRYGRMLAPVELKEMTEAALVLGNLAGMAAVRQDTPELEGS